MVIQDSGRKVPVVQAYAYTKYMGRLDLTFDSKGEIVDLKGNPILLDRNFPQGKI
jgi:2',3'-cyclic-nucleotide 2'-phosphodiesterase (5'-nucleotidase family)